MMTAPQGATALQPAHMATWKNNKYILQHVFTYSKMPGNGKSIFISSILTILRKWVEVFYTQYFTSKSIL